MYNIVLKVLFELYLSKMFEDMHFGDWVAVFTNILTTLTAVIMAYFAWRTYLKTPEQEPEPNDKKANNDEDFSAKQLIVFKTSKQKTILKITSKGLECHLEDNRVGRGGHQWTIKKDDAKLILESSNYYVNSGYKVNTGTFSIGQRRNWLYSKKFFPEPEYLLAQLKDLLNKTISDDK